MKVSNIDVYRIDYISKSKRKMGQTSWISGLTTIKPKFRVKSSKTDISRSV